MAATSMVHVRVDDEMKVQATEALAAMGLTVSDAVRILFTRIVAEQAMPLELKVPNAETLAAMKESRAIIRAHRARFADARELFNELEKTPSKRAILHGHATNEGILMTGPVFAIRTYRLKRLNDVMICGRNEAPLGAEGSISTG